MAAKGILVSLLLLTLSGCGASSAAEPEAHASWVRDDLNVVLGPVGSDDVMVAVTLNETKALDLVALDKSTGATLWRRPTSPSGMNASESLIDPVVINGAVIAPQEFEKSDDLVAWNAKTGSELWRIPFWELRQPWECGNELLCVNGLKDSELGYKTLEVMNPLTGDVKIEESDFAGRGFASDSKRGIEVDAVGLSVAERNDDGSRWKWRTELTNQPIADLSHSDRLSVHEIKSTTFLEFTWNASDGEPERHAVTAIDSETGRIYWSRDRSEYEGSNSRGNVVSVKIEDSTIGVNIQSNKEEWRLSRDLDWDNYAVNGTTSTLVQDAKDKSWIVVNDDGTTAPPKSNDVWWFFNKRKADIRHYQQNESWDVRGWYSSKSYPSMTPPATNSELPLPKDLDDANWLTRIDEFGHLRAFELHVNKSSKDKGQPSTNV